MMFKKILFLVFTILLVSCSSKKPVVRTVNKNPTSTNRTTKTKPITKESSKPKTEIKTVQSEENNSSEELVATSKVSTTTDDVRLYIDSFKDVAKYNMKNHGIPASITLAQGVLESGAGKGRLSTIANNHFGIKCHTGWTGESVSHDDDAAQECFRKYQDPSESYRDHSLFLTSRSRYDGLFKLDKGDYKSWAKGLKAAGYATDPKYPDKLIGIIERYQLYEYDNEVLDRNYKANIAVVVENAENYHIIQKGDTLYSLSKKYNLTVEDLKKMNNMNDNSLSIDQKIKIK
ncbi:glucosaminidase domain-containing protein [Flavobacterium sp. N2270]|uniref:glucosaminidase domain-containing protein n=1 Tax=Flavobacterium sp. N2270 TaxID=2986831 RepID=UPI0029CAC757|nr:glucosaminidase domain-containing protein [Flavobacterium sp. N2270]